MRLINKDITCCVEPEEYEDKLGNAYKNERTYQSPKQNMRVRWHRGKNASVDWWDERPGGCGRGTYRIAINRINGHIRKYIGKSFSKCFHDFVVKLNNPGYMVGSCWLGYTKNKSTNKKIWQVEFLSKFEDGRYYPSDFIVDDQNKVQLNPQMVKIQKDCARRKKEAYANHKKMVEECKADKKRYRIEKSERNKYYDRLIFAIDWLRNHDELFTVDDLVYNDLEEARAMAFKRNYNDYLKGREKKRHEISNSAFDIINTKNLKDAYNHRIGLYVNGKINASLSDPIFTIIDNLNYCIKTNLYT